MFLDKIYGTVANAEQRAFMIENGLIASLGKAIMRFFQKYGSTQPDVVTNGFQKLVITMAAISLRGSAPINVSDVRGLCFFGIVKYCGIFR